MRFEMMMGRSLFFQRSIALLTTACLVAGASVSFAKTDKYKRPSSGSQTTDTTAPSPSSKDSSKDSGVKDSSKDPANPSTSNNGDKKVDLTDLENRYWTAKDTEFSVVQNRLYTKAKRTSLTLQGGAILNDQYTTDYNLGLDINYYFSERHGVEVQFWKTFATNADFVSDFGNRFAIIPDHNLPQAYIGASYNWIPIYAKLSLLEKKILYFDMSISPGLGVTMLRADTFATTVNNPTAVTQNPMTIALDVAQQVFIDEHWAIRLDLRNHYYSETIYGASSGAQTRTKGTYLGTIMFGITYFR